MEFRITEKEILSHPNDYSLGEYVRKKYWEEIGLRKKNRDEHVMLKIDENGRVVALNHDDLEVCVRCGEKTNVPVSMHIDFRNGYVEGVGQFCNSCYNL